MEHDHQHHANPGANEHIAMKHNGMPGNNPPMGHTGHDHHAMMIADFRRRFYAVLVLTIPVMLLSEMIQYWLNTHISFPGAQFSCAWLLR